MSVSTSTNAPTGSYAPPSTPTGSNAPTRSNAPTGPNALPNAPIRSNAPSIPKTTSTETWTIIGWVVLGIVIASIVGFGCFKLYKFVKRSRVGKVGKVIKPENDGLLTCDQLAEKINNTFWGPSDPKYKTAFDIRCKKNEVN